MKDRLIKLLTEFLIDNDGIVYKTNYLSLLYIIEKLSITSDERTMNELFDRIQSETKKFLTSPLELEKLYSIIYHQEDEPVFIYETLNMDDKHCGLYFIYDEYSNLIYIGKSERNVIHRSLESFSNKTLYGSHKVRLFYVTNVDILSDLENDFIMLYKPLFNQTETKKISHDTSYWLRSIFYVKEEIEKSEFHYPVRIETGDI